MKRTPKLAALGWNHGTRAVHATSQLIPTATPGLGIQTGPKCERRRYLIHRAPRLILVVRYVGAEEIWDFYRDRAKEYGVYEHTKFNHRVVGAEWNDDSGKWIVRIEDLNTGKIIEDSSEVFINCAGVLKQV
jgi:hypothetical protein